MSHRSVSSGSPGVPSPPGGLANSRRLGAEAICAAPLLALLGCGGEAVDSMDDLRMEMEALIRGSGCPPVPSGRGAGGHGPRATTGAGRLLPGGETSSDPPVCKGSGCPVVRWYLGTAADDVVTAGSPLRANTTQGHLV